MYKFEDPCPLILLYFSPKKKVTLFVIYLLKPPLLHPISSQQTNPLCPFCQIKIKESLYQQITRRRLQKPPKPKPAAFPSAPLALDTFSDYNRQHEKSKKKKKKKIANASTPPLHPTVHPNNHSQSDISKSQPSPAQFANPPLPPAIHLFFFSFFSRSPPAHHPKNCFSKLPSHHPSHQPRLRPP